MQERVRDVGNSVGDRNLELNGCLELCESTEACRSFVYVISQKQCQMKDKTIVGYESTIRDPDSFTVYKKCDIGMLDKYKFVRRLKKKMFSFSFTISISFYFSRLRSKIPQRMPKL